LSYIGSKPANKPVVASDLDPTVITGQTALAVAPADTDEFLISDAGTLKRLDASLIGGANTPAFFVYKNSSQTLSDVTTTKITWTTEVFDTASAFASDKFTVPSGQDGKYFLSFASHVYDASEKITSSNKVFKKNGSQVSSLDRNDGTYEFVTDNRVASIILDLSAGDYIETFVYANTTDNTALQIYGEAQYYTYFQGFKLIT